MHEHLCCTELIAISAFSSRNQTCFAGDFGDWLHSSLRGFSTAFQGPSFPISSHSGPFSTHFSEAETEIWVSSPRATLLQKFGNPAKTRFSLGAEAQEVIGCAAAMHPSCCSSCIPQFRMVSGHCRETTGSKCQLCSHVFQPFFIRQGDKFTQFPLFSQSQLIFVQCCIQTDASQGMQLLDITRHQSQDLRMRYFSWPLALKRAEKRWFKGRFVYLGFKLYQKYQIYRSPACKNLK